MVAVLEPRRIMRERGVLEVVWRFKGFHNQFGGRTHIGSSGVQLALSVN